MLFKLPFYIPWDEVQKTKKQKTKTNYNGGWGSDHQQSEN